MLRCPLFKALLLFLFWISFGLWGLDSFQLLQGANPQPSSPEASAGLFLPLLSGSLGSLLHSAQHSVHAHVHAAWANGILIDPRAWKRHFLCQTLILPKTGCLQPELSPRKPWSKSRVSKPQLAPSPALPPTNCVTLGGLLNLSVTQRPLLKNRANDITCLMGWSSGLNERKLNALCGAWNVESTQQTFANIAVIFFSQQPTHPGWISWFTASSFQSYRLKDCSHHWACRYLFGDNLSWFTPKLTPSGGRRTSGLHVTCSV